MDRYPNQSSYGHLNQTMKLPSTIQFQHSCCWLNPKCLVVSTSEHVSLRFIHPVSMADTKDNIKNSPVSDVISCVICPAISIYSIPNLDGNIPILASQHSETTASVSAVKSMQSSGVECIHGSVCKSGVPQKRPLHGEHIVKTRGIYRNMMITLW